MNEADGPDPHRGPLRAGVIVAHPDDETIWCGGTILTHPEWAWTVVALCRRDDPDRSPRFFRALEALGATGTIGNLDDEPDQNPLPPQQVRQAVLSLLPAAPLDLILSHSPCGEYTRHRRHEEAGRAVLELWESGDLEADAVWIFAYEDGRKTYLPRPIAGADRRTELSDPVWQKKRRIIREIYGFGPESFEACAAPRQEAFWCFESPAAAGRWMTQKGPRP